LAAQEFYRVERLSALANDTCDMFTDREMVCYGNAKHSDHCDTLDTRCDVLYSLDAYVYR